MYLNFSYIILLQTSKHLKAFSSNLSRGNQDKVDWDFDAHTPPKILVLKTPHLHDQHHHDDHHCDDDDHRGDDDDHRS